MYFKGTASSANLARNLQPTRLFAESTSEQGAGWCAGVVVRAGFSIVEKRSLLRRIAVDGQTLARFHRRRADVIAVSVGSGVDGFEVQVGTNHLGHYALINQFE